MRILIISNIFPPDFIGGYELMALDVASEFAARGHDVLIATSPLMTASGPELNRGFRVSRILHHVSLSVEPDRQDHFSYGVCVNLRNLAVLNDKLIEFNPNVVYCFNLWGLGSVGILWFLLKSGYRPVVHLADNIFQQWEGDHPRFSRFASYFGLEALADDVSWIAMSEVVWREANRSLMISPRNVTFVPGWVRHRLDDARDDVTRNTAVGGETRFVFASRIAPHKGIDLVLDAARKLLDRGETRFVIDVYGGGEVAEWTQRASSRHLDRNIVFKGAVKQDELISSYRQYNALLFPTWEREPFGLVAAEAATQGCIPIMTGSMGASHWFLDGRDCIKIPRESAALAYAMQKVISMDADAKSKFCEAMKHRSRSMFSFGNWYPKMEEIASSSRRASPLDAATQRRIFGATCALTRLWRD